MTILNERSRLDLGSQGALVTNEHGEDVLLELTASESDFLLTFTECPEADHDVAGWRLYFQLRHRRLMQRYRLAASSGTDLRGISIVNTQP